MLNLNFRVMKISKYLLVAAASVMLFSCAKDDNNGASLNGHVALSLKIVTPELGSKAAVGETTATEIAYTEVKVKVNAAAPVAGADEEGWVTLTKQQVTDGYTFWGVDSPTSVEVSINGGEASYTDLTAFKGEDGSAIDATTVPVYGESSDFTFVETGTNPDDAESPTYDIWEITVDAKIPVARLELSGITHKAHDAGMNCFYKTLSFKSINFSGLASGEFSNDAYTGSGEDTPWVETIAEAGTDFLADNVVFPAEENSCYAFYTFAKENVLPTVQFEFVNAAPAEEGATMGPTRYAVIKSFKDAGNGNTEITSFEAGKIYQVTAVEIADEDLSSDPTGNTLVALTVYVTVQDWTVVNTTVAF